MQSDKGSIFFQRLDLGQETISDVGRPLPEGVAPKSVVANLGLAIIAVYANGWLATPILFCASVIGSVLAGSFFVSPQRVLLEAAVTVGCCAVGSHVLGRMGRAGSLTMNVRDLGRMLGVIAITSVLIGAFVYLMRHRWRGQT